MKLFKIALLAFLLISLSQSFSFAQDLTEEIPVDKNVRIGKLDNGIVYYIRHNKKPENRVELRLAVNTGSLCENDEEAGLAHFTEHMCFNGTKNFEKNELVNVLEKMGMKFGGDINAYTGFSETVYMLHIPTDKPGLVDQGFQIIEDWAHNVTFADEEIDKERGVIIEEWRMGLGADDRMRKRSLPIIFKDSRYADRIPIGKKEILENFKYETIRNFYRKWYRPDLQSVIVVGDIDVDEMEKKIIKHFGTIKGPENPPIREVYDIPDNDEPLISIETDEEATQNMVMFFYKHPRTETKTIGDYRQELIESLFNGMMSDRLGELSQKPECPYVMANSSFGAFLARPKDAYMSFGLMKENMIGEGIKAIMTENERVKQHGFTETEFERQKKEIFTNFEKGSKEADKTESRRFASQYVSNFLSKDPIPGINQEFEFVKRFLPEIKLEEINQLAEKWITDKNFVIMITAPKKEGVKVPEKNEILDIIDKVKKTDVEKYVDDVSDAPLLSEEVAGGKITNTDKNEEIGFTKLTLDNGVEVVLKQTDFKNDEILASAYSLGGTSHCSDEDILTSTFSFAIVEQGGVGSFSNIQLEKKLKGKTVQISPIMTDTYEGFQGKCAPKDFETMLKLIYLYTTQPRKDKENFDSFISKISNQMKFLGSSPMMVFQDTLVKTISGNSPRAIAVPKPEQLAKIDLDKAFDFYQDRFSDAGDFKFFFVGNFTSEEILPLIEKYLGGLPSKGRKESFIDKSPKFPDGITEVIVKKGIDQKGMVAIVMNGDFDYNYKNKLHIKVMTEALNIKLREYIREEESGAYTVQIMQQVAQFPKSNYQLFIVFPCAPKNVKKLTKVAFKEVDKIMTNGPTEEDLQKVKENLIRAHEENLKENSYWLNKLQSVSYNNEDFSNFNNFETDIKNITIEDIKKAGQTYLKPEHYVKVVLLPEKK